MTEKKNHGNALNAVEFFYWKHSTESWLQFLRNKWEAENKDDQFSIYKYWGSDPDIYVERLQYDFETTGRITYPSMS